MLTLGISLCLMGLAFVVTMLVFPHVLAFARRHGIVDNPNARKLQRVPVPVMGGTTVFIGVIVSVLVCSAITGNYNLLELMGLIMVMYLIGLWDDVKDVPVSLRFGVEVLVVWLMIILFRVEINDFHGFLGIHEIPDLVSVPLSLFAGVGIINSINLIDGVDGYCSTYGVMSCVMFAIIFYYVGDMTLFTFALIVAGALVPFFFHNVFGKTSKMFLGDGGSLMLGTFLTFCTFCTLSSTSPCAAFGNGGLSMVALTLAILAVPVFDTLKVMIGRVARGQSPFHPDKTHLHHLFIEMNYSHLATSELIVFHNFLVVVFLIIAWKLGASINFQVWMVIAWAFLFTWVFYYYMEYERRQNDGEGSPLFNRCCKRGKAWNLSNTKVWQFTRRMVDSKFLGGETPALEESSSDVSSGSTKIDPRIG
ncbi:MAG: undecaprenyl/decaprenyl-phosphate alpha-N-acetylglucosaminyl 1-phosphate transferase [Bacteroidales bacterium]|nr:undecaprenyl/decaprenyl-phosphate alpha-N-acetylglucosaminyl 1-phosphate transferase [Bacteroidales bacterium]